MANKPQGGIATAAVSAMVVVGGGGSAAAKRLRHLATCLLWRGQEAHNLILIIEMNKAQFLDCVRSRRKRYRYVVVRQR